LDLGVLDTSLCDKVCQSLATGWLFSPGTLVSFTNKINLNDIIEILLKVVLNTISHHKSTNLLENFFCHCCCKSYRVLCVFLCFIFRREPPPGRVVALIVEEYITFLGSRPGFVIDSGSDVS
jgi:hypothetical protein